MKTSAITRPCSGTFTVTAVSWYRSAPATTVSSLAGTLLWR
jgi:hypothetical protein